MIRRYKYKVGDVVIISDIDDSISSGRIGVILERRKYQDKNDYKIILCGLSERDWWFFEDYIEKKLE